MAPLQQRDRGLGRGGKWPTSPSNRKVTRAPSALELVPITFPQLQTRPECPCQDPTRAHARALFRAKAEQAAQETSEPACGPARPRAG